MDNQIQTIILNTLMDLAIAVIPIIGAFIVTFIRKHVTAKQLETAKNIANISVKYAQQLELTNSEKYESALAKAKLFAESHGIKYSDDQWNGLIEFTVNEAKKDWNLINSVDVVESVAIIPNTVEPKKINLEIDPNEINNIVSNAVSYAEIEAQKIVDQKKQEIIEQVNNAVQNVLSENKIVPITPINEEIAPEQ